MRHNVTTPGGFFVGLGGIVAFCIVSSAVYLWFKLPAKNDELQAQQAALGLVAAPGAPRDEVKKKQTETDALLEAAAQKYNDGNKPDIDKLPELRGVIRFREAQKAAAASQTLDAQSSVAGKSVIAAAMEQTAQEIVAKKPAPSKVALAEVAPADPKAAPSLPNAGGGGVHTIQFVNPVPAVPATPAAPAAPQANATPSAPLEATAPVASVQSSRQPLLNGSESK